MKILYVNKYFYLNGGSERVFFQEKAFMEKQGHEVIDFSMKDERNNYSKSSKYFIPNIDYNRNEGVLKKITKMCRFIHSGIATRKVARLIKECKPEIAHLHNIYHQLTPSIISAIKDYGVRVVLTLHDYKLICPSYLALSQHGICTECEGKKFLRPITKHCQKSYGKELLLSIEAYYHKWRKSYDGVDCFIAPSQFLSGLASKRIKKEKLKILPNGIDVLKYKPNLKDSGYCLYFGRLAKEKGAETLLRAHRLIDFQIQLKVVGTGPLEEELKKNYPDVTFLGYQDGVKLHALIANAAFVVVPSQWLENCSMVVLEAMAFGKPVIGCYVGGIPEQIDNGKTGFLFHMGDKIELAEKMSALWKQKELRYKMGIAAREKVEKEFSLEKHCDQLQSIYNQLMDDK